jgi:hypothetical protein
MEHPMAVYQTEIPWWTVTVLLVWLFARVISRVMGSKGHSDR